MHRRTAAPAWQTELPDDAEKTDRTDEFDLVAPIEWPSAPLNWMRQSRRGAGMLSAR
jgi:hypothetical protein